MEELKSKKNCQNKKKKKEKLYNYSSTNQLMSILNGNHVSKCAKMMKDGH